MAEPSSNTQANKTSLREEAVPRSERTFEDLKGTALRTLCYSGMDNRRNDIALAHGSTCDWLFENALFRKWIERKDIRSYNGVLWIKGKPGAGKLTPMKHALLHCQGIDPKPVIASYFFHARGGLLEKSRIGMLRSVSHQLLEQLPQFKKGRFLPLYLENERKHGRDWEWHPNVLEGLIKAVLKETERQLILLFIDALDECSESEVKAVVEMLEAFSQAAVKSGGRVNICLSIKPSLSQHSHDEGT